MALLVFSALRAIWALRRDPQFVSLALLAAVAIISGTAFYSLVEGLRLVDALYFSVVTLTTVGYGDFAPETDVGKLFTAVYALVGIGILLAFVTTLAAKVSQMPVLPSQKANRKRIAFSLVGAVRYPSRRDAFSRCPASGCRGMFQTTRCSRGPRSREAISECRAAAAERIQNAIG